MGTENLSTAPTEECADIGGSLCIMFGIVSRRCAFASRRVWATPPLSVGFSPLVLSAVFGAGTARGKCTKSVELADFLADIGVPDKDVVRMADIAKLQKSRVPTLRDNYTGLVATLGAEGALGGILKAYSLLQSPSDTTSSAHAAWVGILGADGAAAAILKNPAVLRSPADTIKGAHKALVDLLGADGAAEAILNNPIVLKAPGVTIKGAHKALVEALGGVGATAASLKNPKVMTAGADNIKSAGEALTAHLGKEDMLQAVGTNPFLLTKAGDKIHQTAAAIKGLLGDSEGTDLLKGTPTLFQYSATFTEGNFETLCNAFDRELVLKAVRVRPSLLYHRPTANKAVTTGMLLSGP